MKWVSTIPTGARCAVGDPAGILGRPRRTRGCAARELLLAGPAVVSNLLFGGQAIAYLTVGLLTALTPIAIVSGTVPRAGATLMALICFGVGLSLLAPRAGTSVLAK